MEATLCTTLPKSFDRPGLDGSITPACDCTPEDSLQDYLGELLESRNWLIERFSMAKWVGTQRKKNQGPIRTAAQTDQLVCYVLDLPCLD